LAQQADGSKADSLNQMGASPRASGSRIHSGALAARLTSVVRCMKARGM